ncbi:MAG: nucleotidyltransferase domain-containing protein [archaeon]
MTKTGEIQNILFGLEAEYSVRILRAVECGSRAWGFESKDSDWDIRFIYMHNIDWYLGLTEKRDVIEYMQNNLDFVGWDLRKALRLAKKYNPALLEWLKSPITYYGHGGFWVFLRNLMEEHFSPKPLAYHYLHMAEGNYISYFKGNTVSRKKYFYVLRPLMAVAWLKRYNILPPISFADTYKNLELDKEIEETLDQLIKEKKVGMEKDPTPRIKILDYLITDLIQEAKDFCLIAEVCAIPLKELNNLFLRTLRD